VLGVPPGAPSSVVDEHFHHARNRNQAVG